MPETAPVPTPDRKPAWRAAVLAYRKVRATGALDHPAHLAAKAAVLELLPTLSDQEASQEAVLWHDQLHQRTTRYDVVAISLNVRLLASLCRGGG
jgi:hypothetical protein